MKNLIQLFTFFLIISNTAIAQDIYFFSEGTDNTFYDQGIVDVNNLGETTFEYTHPPNGEQWNDKLPCSTTAYNGATSLKFSYTSSANGNWMVKVFRNDWSAVNLTSYDKISFYIYSENSLPAVALPQIGIIALDFDGSVEVASKLYNLSDYNNDIPAAQWTKVEIPLNVIIEDSENSALNFATVKAIKFNQSETANTRLILIDELLASREMSNVPSPINFTATGYDSHAELNWEQPMEQLSYKVYASFDDGQNYELRTETTDNFYMDFVPENGKNKNVKYRAITVAEAVESDPVEATAEITDFTDDELIDMVQRYTFRYFWEGAHESGMALERSNGNAVASGASGMGLMAMIVAHEREYEPQEEIKDRLIKMLNFLETCERHHGAWSHWYNGDTKETRPFSPDDDGGDIVETSFVAEGLVALKNYFSGDDAKSTQIRTKADQLWKEIDWDWYRNGEQNILYWHWSPNNNFDKNMKVSGWNECLITYIMAASSPTHGIPKEVYTEGWARSGNIVNRRTFYTYPINLSPNWGGPLFWLHYTHLGINPHGLTDQYADYWQEYVNTTKIHYEYAIDNPLNHTNYSDKCWGLTASDDPNGYTAHKPWDNDNGTISPTAALSSMPYAPEEVMKALKYFYRERGSDLFGKYGTYDAFNDNLNWVKEAYIGIDQGPIVVMLENYRTGLLWDMVTEDTDVQAGMNKLGFGSTSSIGLRETERTEIFDIYPNPSKSKVFITMADTDRNHAVSLQLFSTDGRLVLTKTFSPNTNDLFFDCTDLQDGLYLINLKSGNIQQNNKLMIQK